MLNFVVAFPVSGWIVDRHHKHSTAHDDFISYFKLTLISAVRSMHIRIIGLIPIWFALGNVMKIGLRYYNNSGILSFFR